MVERLPFWPFSRNATSKAARLDLPAMRSFHDASAGAMPRFGQCFWRNRRIAADLRLGVAVKSIGLGPGFALTCVRTFPKRASTDADFTLQGLEDEPRTAALLAPCGGGAAGCRRGSAFDGGVGQPGARRFQGL